MTRTVVGLFDDRTDAQAAVEDLIQQGYPKESISMVASDAARAAAPDGGTRSDHATAGAGYGAGAGAVLGGVAGFLLGVGVFAIPGLGPLVAAGTIATTLAGIAAGAAAGGLVGALVGMGVPQEEALYYAEGVRRGGTLIAVSVNDQTAGKAADILRRHHAVNVKERAEQWRQRGWPGYDPNAPAYSVEDAARERARYAAPQRVAATAQQAVAERPVAQASAAPQAFRDYDDYEMHFRRDFETRLTNNGLSYDRHVPAYRYGYYLATDPGYRGKDWDAVEPGARAYWEERNPGTWDQFRSAVRYAWDTVRGHM